MPVPLTPFPARTSFEPNNLHTVFDVSNVQPGQILRIRTANSDWYITVTARRRVDAHAIYGAFIQTSSKTFGQIRRSPDNVTIGRAIHKGGQFMINGRPGTGAVEQVWLDNDLIIA